MSPFSCKKKEVSQEKEALPGYKNRHVRNQSSRYFRLDINCRGKKFDLQGDLLREMTREGIRYKLHKVN